MGTIATSCRILAAILMVRDTDLGEEFGFLSHGGFIFVPQIELREDEESPQALGRLVGLLGLSQDHLARDNHFDMQNVHPYDSVSVLVVRPDERYLSSPRTFQGARLGWIYEVAYYRSAQLMTHEHDSAIIEGYSRWMQAR